MLRAVAEAALSRPRAMLGGAVVVLLALGLFALGAPREVGVAAAQAPGSASAAAGDEIAEALGREPEPGMLIVTRGRDPVDSAVYEVALETVTSQLHSDDEVAAVRRGPVSDDERTTVLEVYFRDDNPTSQQDAVERLESELDAGPLSVAVAGEAATLLDARRSLGGEVVGLELLALPLTVLVLALVVGLRLVAAPLLASALAMLGAAAVLRLLAAPLDLSLVGLLPASAVALALATEMSLLIARRHRDELESDGDPDRAIEHAVQLAGRPVIAAAVGGALIPLCLLVVPVTAARSAAIGAASAALLAGIAALLVTPSVLALAGPRPEELDPDAQEPRGIVPRVTGLVGERRLVALLAVLAAAAGLLALASLALDPKTVALGSSGVPADADSRRAEDQLAAELGIEAGSRATASLPRDADAHADELRDELGAVSGVAETSRPDRSGDVEAVGVGLEARRGSLVARDAIRAGRAALSPLGAEISGYDAAALDADEELVERLPVAAAIAAFVLALLIFVLVRRPFLAIGLGFASLLPAAAASGLLVLVFADGRLAEPLDYAPNGAPHLDALVAVLAAAVAVSAARSAAYPIVLRGERTVAVRRRAAERAARLVLVPAGAATMIAAAAAGVLVGSDVVPVKEAGIAIAAALVLDLVALRALLVPGLGRLLQRAHP